jgi:hypothetical protein
LRTRATVTIQTTDLEPRLDEGLCVTLLDSDGRQCFAVFDVDNETDFESTKCVANHLVEVLREEHIPFLITFSGKKGFHLWVFFTSPIPTGQVWEWQQYILERAGFEYEGVGKFKDTNGTIIETLFASGSGKVIKVPFSRHQARRDYFEIPIPWSSVADYNRDLPPTPADFDTALAVFNAVQTCNSERITSLSPDGATVYVSHRRSRSSAPSVTLPIFQTPDQATLAQDDIVELVDTTPCLKECKRRATELRGIYTERAILVAALSRAGFTREDIAYWFKHNINDADDNNNVGKLEYQVNYWYIRAGLASCRVLQQPGDRFLCQNRGNCKAEHPGDITVLDPSTIEEYTDKIIKKGKDVVVYKPTRAGVTTNVIISSVRVGKKLLCVVPTNLIANQTVSEAMARAKAIHKFEIKAAVVGDNRVTCLTEMLRADDIRRQHFGDDPSQWGRTAYDNLPFVVRGSCAKCQYNQSYVSINTDSPVYSCDRTGMKCAYATILKHIGDFDVLVLTYAKLRTILMSTSDSALQIKHALETFKVVLFDEIRTFTDNPTLEVLTQEVTMDGHEVYNILKKLETETLKLVERQENSTTHDIRTVGAQIKKKLKPYIRTPNQTTLDDWRAQIQKDCARISNILNEDEIEICLNFFARYAQIIRYVAQNNEGLPATIDALQLYMQEDWIISNVPNLDYKVNLSTLTPPKTADTATWLNSINAQLILTDATMPLVDFPKMFDREFKTTVVHDTRGMARKSAIIADNRHVSASNIEAHMDDVKRVLAADMQFLRERGMLNQYIVVAPSMRIASPIAQWVVEQGYADATVTYHRSPLTVGVSSTKRIMRCLCTPFPPENASDFLAEIREEVAARTKEELQEHDAAKTYQQTIGRAKDPSAENASLVLNYGITHAETLSLLRGGCDPPRAYQPAGVVGSEAYYMQLDGWLTNTQNLTRAAVESLTEYARTRISDMPCPANAQDLPML